MNTNLIPLDNSFLNNDHIFKITDEFINYIKKTNKEMSQTLLQKHGLLFWGNAGLGKTTIIKLLHDQIIKTDSSIKVVTLDINAYVLKNNVDVIINALNNCLQYSLRNIIIFIDNLDTLTTPMQMVINIWIYNNIFTNNIYFISTCTNILNILPSIVELNTVVDILPRNYELWTDSFLALAKKENYLEPIDSNTLEYIYSVSSGNGHLDLQMLNKLVYFSNIECTRTIIYKNIINELCNNNNNKDNQLNHTNQNIIKNCFELITLGEDIVDIFSTILHFIMNANNFTTDVKNNASYICNMYIHKRKNSKYNSITDKVLIVVFCNKLIDVLT